MAPSAACLPGAAWHCLPPTARGVDSRVKAAITSGPWAAVLIHKQAQTSHNSLFLNAAPPMFFRMFVYVFWPTVQDKQ